MPTPKEQQLEDLRAQLARREAALRDPTVPSPTTTAPRPDAAATYLLDDGKATYRKDTPDG